MKIGDIVIVRKGAKVPTPRIPNFGPPLTILIEVMAEKGDKFQVQWEGYPSTLRWHKKDSFQLVWTKEVHERLERERKEEANRRTER